MVLRVSHLNFTQPHDVWKKKNREGGFEFGRGDIIDFSSILRCHRFDGRKTCALLEGKKVVTCIHENSLKMK